MLRAIATPLPGVLHANALRPHVQLGTTRMFIFQCLVNKRLRTGALRCSSSSSEAATNPSSSTPRSIRAQRNYKAHRSGRSCSCGSQLSNHWHIDPDSGGPLCKICYSRRRTERLNSGTNSCLDCGTKTSGCWYTHPSTGTLSRCQYCKTRHQREQHELAGAICRDCGTTKAYRWTPHASRDGSFRCDSCQKREWSKDTVFPGRSCLECGTETSQSQWYKHPSGNHTSWCDKCWHRHYDRERYRRNKIANEERLGRLAKPGAGNDQSVGSGIP
ncbi:hypothetical protein PENSPDRAFT_651938 [Peniophora sp. CONT]|nr:hypothetical protein PENSPDRAFT_651938 [Peniophora sp. CONT]